LPKFDSFEHTNKHTHTLQRENNLLHCRWHERGCTVELCAGTAATVACVPSVTVHGQATYDSGAPAIEKRHGLALRNHMMVALWARL
jgi:hypothetical protein